MMLDGKSKILKKTHPLKVEDEDDDMEIAQDNLRKRNRSVSINSIVSDVSV